MKSQWSKILDKKVDTQYSPTASDWSSMQTMLDAKAGASSWWSFSKIAVALIVPLIATAVYLGLSTAPNADPKLESNTETPIKLNKEPLNTIQTKSDPSLRNQKEINIDQNIIDQNPIVSKAPSENMEPQQAQTTESLPAKVEEADPITPESIAEKAPIEEASGNSASNENPQNLVNRTTQDVLNNGNEESNKGATIDTETDFPTINEQPNSSLVETESPESTFTAEEDNNPDIEEEMEKETEFIDNQEEDSIPESLNSDDEEDVPQLNKTGLKLSDFKLAALEFRGAYGLDTKKDYLFSYNAGLELAFSYQENWNLNTGVQYSNWWEKSKEEINSTTTYDTSFSSRVDTSVLYYVDSNWVVNGQGQGGRVYDTLYYFQTDTVQEPQVDSTVVSNRDQLTKLQLISRVSIPLMFSYNTTYKKFRVELALGPILNFSKYSTYKFEQELSTFSMDLAIRPTLSYSLSPSFDIMAFADYRSQISGETDDFIPETRLNYGLGLRYNFK